MTNQLANETSPYLLQHADNPVDWYPWGEEALEKARREDKPIFLSIGYAACHWCHVMAHESFEDPQVAQILNQHFVSIKVDREERPDLDRIYMTAVQALTGSGGWPMSVFLTPDGEPFFGGTYFPPEPRYGMPSFADVLLSVADAWRNRRHELERGSRQLTAAIQQQMTLTQQEPQGACRPATLSAALRNLEQSFDETHGGWGGAPKFPQSMVLEFLLRRYHVTREADLLSMVTQTLDAMARGGMYDQLGGGFHRYSVDDHWLVPHFEKMLYDNALLAPVYLHAWQVTGNPFYRTIVEEILDYVAREMTDPQGGFYSTQDADSEGEEGKFYVWTPQQIRDVLGEETDRFMEAYGVTQSGNFEGKNILTLEGSPGERDALAGARQRLYEAREERVHPGRDEKVLTSWNGLMLAAFAEAARALDREDYRAIAVQNADFLLRELMTDEGRLLHTWKDGAAKINGYLEDYTYLSHGLIELYQTTFDIRYYLALRDLMDVMEAHFRAPVGFYDTSDDHEELIVRPREVQDNAVPSGNSMANSVLLRMAGLAAEPEYKELAWRNLCQMQELMARHPLGFGVWLSALSYLLSHPHEIGIVGEPEAEDTQALLAVCREGYRPHQVIAVDTTTSGELVVPLLQRRDQFQGQAMAYVCVDSVCHQPVSDPEALEELLEETRDGP